MSGALARLNPWRGLGDHPKTIWIHFAATLINRLGTMAIPFLVLYLTQERGFDPEHAGLMLGIYGGTSLIVTPILGKWADRIGHVRMMKASLLSSGLVLLAYPFARTPAQVTVATILFAVTAEAFRPASLSVLTDLAPAAQRKAAFAANRLAINLGMSVGPAVGGYLAEISFPAIFRVDGSSTLLAWILLAVTGFKVVEHVGGPGSSEHGTGSVPGYRNPLLLTFLAACVPLAAVFFQHEGALPLDVVRDLGMKESFFGWMFTINTILIVLFEVRLNLTTSHWSHGRSLATGGMFLAAGFGAMAFATTPLTVALTVVVWTIGEMILLPSMSNFVAEIAPSDRRGEYMGLYSMAWGIAFAVGPWLGTVVLERFGRVTLWSGCFVAAALAAAALARLPSPSRASVPAGVEP